MAGKSEQIKAYKVQVGLTSETANKMHEHQTELLKDGCLGVRTDSGYIRASVVFAQQSAGFPEFLKELASK